MDDATLREIFSRLGSLEASAKGAKDSADKLEKQVESLQAEITELKTWTNKAGARVAGFMAFFAAVGFYFKELKKFLGVGLP